MPDIDNQIAFWNETSKTKTFSHPVDNALFQKWVTKDARILDYGCGYGRTGNDLNRMGYANCLGVDTSEEMIRRGQREFPDLQLTHLAGHEADLAPSTFDSILLFAVLTCIPSDVEQLKLISHLHDLLRPGGLIYVSDYWLQTDARNQKRYEAQFNSDNVFGVFKLRDGGFVRHHTQSWIRNLFKDFEMIHERDHTFKSMNGNASACFQKMARKKQAVANRSSNLV